MSAGPPRPTFVKAVSPGHAIVEARKVARERAAGSAVATSRKLSRPWRPFPERTPKLSFGYVVLAIRVRGTIRESVENSLTPTLSPQACEREVTQSASIQSHHARAHRNMLEPGLESIADA